MKRRNVLAGATLVLAAAACSDTSDPASPLLPPAPPDNPQITSAAWTFDVLGNQGRIVVTPPSRGIENEASLQILGDYFGFEPSAPDLSILAGDVVEVLADNSTLNFSPVGQFLPGFRRITFDIAIRNRLFGVDLIAPTFPTPPAGTQGPLIFPFETVVTTTSGGVTGGQGDGTDVIVELPSEGQVAPSVDFDNAPSDFFNDDGCGPTDNDCYRSEEFASPISAGSTSEFRTIGFDAEATVSQFRWRGIVAADLTDAVAQPPNAAVELSGPTEGLEGSTQTLTVTVENTRNSDLTDVELTVDLDPQGSLVDAGGLGGTFPQLTTTIATLAGGATQTFDIQIALESAAESPNSTTATIAAAGDDDPADNSATFDIAINADVPPPADANVFGVFVDGSGAAISDAQAGSEVFLQVCSIETTQAFQADLTDLGGAGINSSTEFNAVVDGVGACASSGNDVINQFTAGALTDPHNFQSFSISPTPGSGVQGIALIGLTLPDSPGPFAPTLNVTTLAEFPIGETITPEVEIAPLTVTPGTGGGLDYQPTLVVTTLAEFPLGETITPNASNVFTAWVDGSGAEITGPVAPGTTVVLQVCSIETTQAYQSDLTDLGGASLNSSGDFDSTTDGVGACASSGSDVINQFTGGALTDPHNFQSFSISPTPGSGVQGIAEISITLPGGSDDFNLLPAQITN